MGDAVDAAPLGRGGRVAQFEMATEDRVLVLLLPLLALLDCRLDDAQAYIGERRVGGARQPERAEADMRGEERGGKGEEEIAAAAPAPLGRSEKSRRGKDDEGEKRQPPDA